VTEAETTVFVVDDDVAMRRSLENLIRSVGLRVEAFASAQEFLSSKREDVPGCLVLDVRLPGLSGLELQQRLVEGDLAMPIIFITGHGDIPMTVQAMKAGLLEVVHIVVVNKGDLAGADTTLQDLRDWYPTVLRTVATTGDGIPGLVAAIAAHQRLRDLHDSSARLIQKGTGF